MSEKSKSMKSSRAVQSLNSTTNLETRKKCCLEPGLKTLGLPQTPRIRRALAQVNLLRNIVVKQVRGAAEEPVQAISTEQGLETEAGLLCYVHQVMADAIPEFLLMIVHREIRDTCQSFWK